MPIRQSILTGCSPVLIWSNEVDATTRAQLEKLSQMPFVHSHIAVMPDCHAGIGSTVGTVIPTHRAIIPAAVGVDIGCGMIAQRLGLTASDLPDNLAGVRSAIEAAIPHGRTNNGGPGDRGAWMDLPYDVEAAWLTLGQDDRFRQMAAQHPKLFARRVNSAAHLGTLGTGNHFVELCLDTEDNVWLMLHSGSRGIGNRIGMYFIEVAKKEMERWYIQLPDADLAYLPVGSEHFGAYWDAMSWAQDYAMVNRELMMRRAVAAVSGALGRPIQPGEKAINCHHNYASLEHHDGRDVYVTRKGAIRAREGDLGIIPGSMGAKSFIVRGRGNEASFCSCSHGAGRVMSRGEAKRRFTVADLAVQTQGVECRKDADVIDEIPAAYKDIDTVMANQSDLVEVVATLRQVVCVKG